MSEFHFDRSEERHARKRISKLCNCGGNFIDSHGKQIRMENKETFQAEVPKFRNKGNICVVVVVAILAWL